MDMSNLNTTHHFDVIIVGSGGAGLSLALSLPQHFNIAVLAKSNLTDASTFYAQGGVAAVLDETDSIEQHIDDTMIAGAYLCETEAVKQTVEGGKPSVEFLLKHGVQFTLDDQEQLHLTREGGHSQRRIIHAADATGRAISTTLVERAIEKDNMRETTNDIKIIVENVADLNAQDAQTVVTELNKTITLINQKYDELNGRVDIYEGDIAELENWLTSRKTEIENIINSATSNMVFALYKFGS